jgi:two-component system NtrC family sensor kinase
MIRTVDEKGDHFETKHRRKDGSIFDVEISSNAASFAGQKLVFCVCRDITERKKTENELRRSEEKFARVWRSSPDPLMLISTINEHIVEVNESFLHMTGFTLDEVIGKTSIDLNLWTDLEDYDHFLVENINQGQVPNTEVNIRIKSGEIRYCVVLGELLELPDGLHILGIIRDITERKKMQDSLLITDRLASIGELTAGIAHELNNPLTSVIGFAEILLEEQLPENIKETVQLMCNEARRTGDVVKNMLTFARRHPLTKEAVDINSIITRVLEMRTYEHNLSNIRVIKQLEENLPYIHADLFKLQQVFFNIIINAEYFMKEAHSGGTLTITTRKTGGHIEVSIADDGPGIKKEAIQHIFDPFYTTKPTGKGTGLGLSICHSVISEHGGRIWVESILGQGATFIMELPIPIDT